MTHNFVYDKKYRDDHKKEIKEYNDKYRAVHKEERRLNAIKYNKEHRNEHREQSRTYREAHREEMDEYTRNWNRLKQYGITIEEYNQLFENQNGCCAVCGKHQSEFKKALCVDHNHETSEVRGLLCHNCNILLGMAKDNINILLDAVEYLRKGE